jgi:hemolysin activation/secretion protein
VPAFVWGAAARLCCSALVLAGGATWAQVVPPASIDLRPGRVVPTPAELAPHDKPVTDVRDLPARPPLRELAKPQGDLTLDVRGYALSPNAPAALVAALPSLLAPYVGAARSYEDLVNAAADVTRYLQRESGFYLGYAYLPEQAPSDGIIRIDVLEGRLDRIELDWAADLPIPRAVIEAYLARLKPGEILKVGDVERVVFLINDLRGINARFDVLEGTQPGYASLRVTGAADNRWAGKADADLNGSRYLGLARLGGLLAGNSLLGRGDALTVNGLASTTGGLLFGLVGYTLPLGSDGVKVGSSLSVVRYKLDEDEFPLGVNGDAVTLNAYALYPWIRSRNLNLFVVSALDLKHNVDRQDVGNTALTRQINSLSVGITGDVRDSVLGGAVSSFDGGVAGGNVRYPDGPRDGLHDAPQFTKLTLGMNRLQNLVDGRLMLYAALRGQWALANLDTIEQFRIGGPDGVRAFSPGEGTGDSGVVLNLELRLLPPEAWLGRLARETVFSLFYDHGEVQFRHDPSRELASFINRATFSGAGLSVAWERPGDYALRVSLSSRLSGVPKADKQQGDPKLYAQLSKLF